MSKLVLVFDIYNNDKHLGTKEFDQEAIALGSGPQAALQIEDDAISPLHAVFNITDSVVKLVDLGAGGLVCNGEPVNSSVEVKSGDVIELHGIRLELKIRSEGASEADNIEVTDKVPISAALDDNTDESAATDEPELTSTISAPPPLPAESNDETAAQAPNPPPPAPPVENQSVQNESSDSNAEQYNAEMVYPTEADLDFAVMEDEKPLDFVMGFSSEPSQHSDTKVPHLLEVAQIYGNEIFDVKHFQPRATPIYLGPETGFKLRFAGLPIAWVPKAFAKFGWIMYPFTESHEEWKSDFFAPLPEQVPLFEFENDTAVCTIQKDWDGFVTQGEEKFTFADLVEQNKASSEGETTKYTLAKDSRIILNTGFSTYFAQLVPATKKIPVGLAKQVDYPFLAVLIFMGALFGTLTFIMMQKEPQEIVVDEDIQRLVQVELEEEPEEEEPEEIDAPDANPDAGEGAKAKEEEGKVGKKDAALKEAKGDKRVVQEKVNNEAAVSDFMDDIDMGFNDDSADQTFEGLNLSGSSSTLGGPLGAKGNQMGSGGLGTRGGGIGGGGTAGGLGGMGSKGTGRGSSGYGTGAGTFGKKKKANLGRIGGTPIIMGSLDKSLIKKVIDRNMNRIRFCYQRQLAKNPGLGGTIKMSFTIATNGSVSKARVYKSTMGSKVVESCLAKRFRSFKFPKPKKGVVLVKYPFKFGAR